MNPDVGMSAGKAMAQVGHGAQLAWWELSETERKAWREAASRSPSVPLARPAGAN